MRRTTVWFGKSGPKIGGLTKGELANDGARASSSEVGTPSFAVFSQKRCAAYNSSYLCLRGNWASPCGPGCWLRSSPASGSSPSRAAIPDAKRRVPRTSAAADPIGSSFMTVLRMYALRMRRMETTISRSSPASYGKTAFVDAGHTDDVVLAVDQGGNELRGRKMCTSAHHASGEGPSPLSNGLSLVLVRPSTINPQGVRYASVRPLRLRLRGDRGRPRTRRRLSSGDGPRRKTGAFQCRTISPSLRTTPSIWPAR